MPIPRWIRDFIHNRKESRMNAAILKIQQASRRLDAQERALNTEIDTQARITRTSLDPIERRRASQMEQFYLRKRTIIHHCIEILNEEEVSIRRSQSAKQLLRGVGASDGARQSYY